MRHGPLTPGEQAFVQYLYLSGLRTYTYEPPDGAANTHPDFHVHYRGTEVIVEVKEFDAPHVYVNSFATFDPLQPVREKINTAARQFRAFKQHPCCLLLVNQANPLLFLTDPVQVYGAMYGTPAFRRRHDANTGLPTSDPPELVFTTGGKMHVSESGRLQNTTFSAIAVLRRVRLSSQGRSVAPTTAIDLFRHGIITYCNPHARIPLPEALFTYRYDRVFAQVGDDYVCTSEGIGLRFEERLA